jgi:hypothetical protein
VCGASFAATVAPRAPAPDRDARTAAALSLLWPGVGHAYLGDWGQALARAVAGAWVTFVALLLGVSAGPGAPAALLFSVAALALTLVAAHDAYRAAAGRPQEAILSGRALTWVFVALMCLSLVAVVASGLTALA